MKLQRTWVRAGERKERGRQEERKVKNETVKGRTGRERQEWERRSQLAKERHLLPGGAAAND